MSTLTSTTPTPTARALVFCGLLGAAFYAASCAGGATAEPSPTPAASSPEATPEASATDSASPTPEATETPSPAASASPEPVAKPPMAFVAKRVETGPGLDELLDSPVWEESEFAGVMLEEAMGEAGDPTVAAVLRAVHDGTRLYIAVEWEDTTEDSQHKPWIWNELDEAYESGAEIEDGMTVAFELAGEFTGNMLSPIETTWDVWMWQACRTAFGYAKDKVHKHTFDKPEGEAVGIPLGEKTLWIARPADAGDPVSTKVPAPAADEGSTVASIAGATPSGSAADVACLARYSNGIWRVVFTRVLATGNADDCEFTPGGVTRMAIAAFDHEEDGYHAVSGVIELTLAE